MASRVVGTGSKGRRQPVGSGLIPTSVLTVDNGSSSLKYDLYHVRRSVEARTLDHVLGGEVSARGSAIDTALQSVWRHLARTGIEPTAVGHRIIFGGPHDGPAHVEPVILQELEAYVRSYPMQLQSQLDVITATQERFPDVPQVLCFDTAFFFQTPTLAQMLPIPRRLMPRLRRYGFHGLSMEYIASKVDTSVGRTAIVHLGSEASVCALRDGAPIDSTMGHSVLGGLMTATRPGDLDPGVLLELLADQSFTAHELGEMLNHACGLLGVSNLSSDMQVLLEAAKTDTAARQAIDLFVYQIIKHVGSMVAVLGGLDRLVFTGGIGEHVPEVRTEACKPFAYLGIEIDPAANIRNDAIVSKPLSRVPVHVIHNDVNVLIARQAVSLLDL